MNHSDDAMIQSTLRPLDGGNDSSSANSPVASELIPDDCSTTSSGADISGCINGQSDQSEHTSNMEVLGGLALLSLGTNNCQDSQVEASQDHSDDYNSGISVQQPRGDSEDILTPGKDAPLTNGDAQLMNEDAQLTSEDVPSSTKDPSPLSEDTPPLGEDVPPPSEVAPLSGEDVPPPSEVAPLSGEDAPPSSEDISLIGKDISPPNKDILHLSENIRLPSGDVPHPGEDVPLPGED
ncbi:hypothetical protein BGX27_008849, partial [Mortierella sp. AM989]